MEVIILAGGLGTRLRSVVSDVPKCMAPVGGKPFLWYLLEGLKRFDVERVILSVGYLREVIEQWIADHASEYPFEFCFAVEEKPLGTGGGIKLAASKAAGPEVVVLNGDTWFDADLGQLVEFRRQSGKPIAVALKPLRDFDRYGRVELAPDGIVRAFKEKQHCEAGLINGGIYALDRDSGIFDGLPEKFSFEKDVLEPRCAAGELCGLVQDGYFIDIGVPDDYARACSAPWLLLTGHDTLLLDRDGVINVLRPGDYVKTIDEFEWRPGIKDALREAASRFRRIFIVTNQRGVGRGVMSREALEGIHEWMTKEISASGGRIDGIYVCTAVSDSDPCRKPNRGLFDQILSDHPSVNPSRTLMVGDSPSDALFARNCGVDYFMVE